MSGHLPSSTILFSPITSPNKIVELHLLRCHRQICVNLPNLTNLILTDSLDSLNSYSFSNFRFTTVDWIALSTLSHLPLLMPELRFEQEISENDIQAAIQKFAQNFAQVYPSSGPALYMGTLNEAMNHSLFDFIEVDFQTLTAATHVFCKNVLCNSEVINYLDKNYLVWPWYCTKDANYQR
ncbi:unnamed protein product [Rotaria sp. Silwood1]|nr:unnamed protein product [Rotaria sp. Silwood1]